MKKRFALNIGNIIALTAAFLLTYYLLLGNTSLHTSIASIISNSQHLAIKHHLLVLGLLPVYIACMIFGSALLGIYFGPAIQQFLVRTTGLNGDISK